jgi:hypothetical protein
MEEAMTAVLINELDMQVCHIGVKKRCGTVKVQAEMPINGLV